MTRPVVLAGYVVIVVCALGVEVAARRRGRATFGDALGVLLRPPPVRLVVLAAWLWFGWHVFVRVDWQDP